jgi:excisionase family DNA binding protein
MAVYLTAEQVAARLQCSEQTVWRLLRSGELPGLKLRKQWRVSEDHLAEYMARLSEVK